MAPAKTGRARSRRIVVTNTDQANKGIISTNIPRDRKFLRVLIKLTAPRIEEMPAKCREKIAQSTEAPPCAVTELKGGYTVQPVPAPASTNPLIRSRTREGRRNQNLILFSRGKAMSGAPIISGTSQFPNPPIRIGITMKKIITKAWAVTTTLNT